MSQVTHPCYCPMCHEPAEEVAVGQVLRYSDSSGKLIGYGHPGGPLGYALTDAEVAYTYDVVDGERVPGSHPCPNCAAEIAQHRKECELEVMQGGVHWQCSMCNAFGVIVKDDSQGFAAEVRLKAGAPPPTQIGVRFINCGQHESTEDRLTVQH